MLGSNLISFNFGAIAMLTLGALLYRPLISDPFMQFLLALTWTLLILWIVVDKLATLKVVVNKSTGGYRLSKDAYEYLGLKWDGYGFMYINDRSNWKLIKLVKNLGAAANGRGAKLKIIKIPAYVKWEIDKGDNGIEWVSEKHRVWN